MSRDLTPDLNKEFNQVEQVERVEEEEEEEEDEPSDYVIAGGRESLVSPCRRAETPERQLS